MDKINKYLFIVVSLILASFFFLATGIYAQTYTTVIGGEGQPEVEVNLNSIHNKTRSSNKLKYPGQKISKKITLVWPKNIKEISNTPNKKIMSKEVMQNAPIEKVSREKLYSKNLKKLERSTVIRDNRSKRKIKIIQKEPLTSEKIINPKRTELKLPNKIKEAKTFNSQSDKISRLDNKSKLSESNNFQRIIFKPTQTNLDKKYLSELSKIASMSIRQNSRIQIKAYASTSGNRPTYARRVSLSRALAIRTELIQFGVNSTNIDVRALGEVNDGNQTDRVDVSIMPQ
ncbi:MAG: hypothetical protein CMM49_02540 [Rhodospirillaceae bacterium]|nr:hypothetical protein [Rhodospirillaceae bacterium]